MAEVAVQFLIDITVVMVVIGISALVFPRFKLPPALGYMIGGLILATGIIPSLEIQDVTSVNFFADLGIILLMFSLGLEFNFKRLKKVGLLSLVAGTIEIIIMLTIGYSLGRVMGWNQLESIFLGAVMSISSTALITKALMDSGRLSTEHGEAIVGILIIEDFFVILVLTLASPLTSGTPLEIFSILELVMIILIFLALSTVLGIAVIPRAIDWVVLKFREETVLLVSLGLCFGMAILSLGIGLSVAIGAFVMGIIISQADSVETVISTVKPVSIVFIAIFFVSIGLLIEPGILVNNILPALLIAGVFLITKLFSVTTGTYASNLKAGSSLLAGMGMLTMGEFSFIIAKTGMDTGAVGPSFYSQVISAALVTMLLYPFFDRYSQSFLQGIKNRLPRDWLRTLREMDRLRSGVKKRLSDSTLRASEAKNQVTMIFIDTIIMAIIILAVNSVYYFKDSIFFLQGIDPSLLGLGLLFLAIPLTLPPIISIIFRIRALINLYTICALESGECRRRDRKAVTKLFTELITGIIGLILLFLIVPFVPGVEGISWIPLMAVMILGFAVTILLWDTFHYAHKRFAEALKREIVEEEE